MSASSAERNPVEALAEEFAERFRRGERPALSEYVERFPQWADEIRELFPALVMMEQFKPGHGETTGPGTATSDDRPPLERLDDYRILREVGRGGMGIVYEAEQESLGRHVALKALPGTGMLNPTFLERFRREAKAAARLHHTNIVPVFGVGESAGVHFYAMQFIRGEGLDKVLHDLRRLRRVGILAHEAPTRLATPADASLAGSLLTGSFGLGAIVEASPESRALAEPGSHPPSGLASLTTPLSSSGSGKGYYHSVARIGLQVAEALSYAHRQGILHRDVKPSNLLLDTQGTVWITDFGLAKVEGAEELTHPGDIVGTVRFMAPERFDGQSLPQSDIYGLGVTLYELLTLRPAFEDTNKARLVERVLHQLPVAPSKLEPSVPRDLETIVLKCLEKDPAARYGTAETLAEDLRRFLADRPIHARRASSAERLWRWCRRNPAVATLLTAVALLLLLVASISTVMAARLNGALSQKIAAEREARLREADALVGQAHGIRFSHRPGQRTEALASLEAAAAIGRKLQQPPDWFDRLRNEAIACMALADMQPAQEWAGWPTGSHGLDFDGELTRYARTEADGTVSVRSVANDAEWARLPTAGDVSGLRFSDDGQFLAVAMQMGKFLVWRLSGKAPIPICEGVIRTGGALEFDRESRQLAVGRSDGSIALYALNTGQEVRCLEAGAPPCSLRFHPSQLLLAVASHTVTQVRELSSGAILAEIPQVWDAWPVVAWSPDGKTLATVGGDAVITLWDWVAKKQVGRLEGVRNQGTALAFNHSGNLLASTGWDRMLRLWDPRTGKELFSTQASMGALRFSPDDRRLAGEGLGTRLRIWEVIPSREYHPLVRAPALGKNNFQSSSFSPTGPLLAVGMDDGFGLWDRRASQGAAFTNLSEACHVLFEPSGALLTNCRHGLFRWPIETAPYSVGCVRLGPPQRLPVQGTYCQIACSRDGQVIASGGHSSGTVVYHCGPPARVVRLGPHADVRYVAVSPDGRWVATGSQGSSSVVMVWDAQSGRLEKDLASGGGAQVAFSPDGCWLATGGDGVRVWATDTWKRCVQLEGLPLGGLAFSPDSRLLAFETGYGVVRLVDPATGREFARLENPDQARGTWIEFSPDGTQLVASGYVWDLAAIRQKLAEIGLDWDTPPLPPRGSDHAQPTLSVAIEMGELVDDLALGIQPPREHLQTLVGWNSWLIALQPFNWQAYRQRGRASAALGEIRQAIADYSLALACLPAADPQRVALLGRRAAGSLDLGESAAMFRDLQAMDQIDPAGGASARAQFARMLGARAFKHQWQDPQRALSELRLAVQLDPANRTVQNNLAWLLATGPPGLRNPQEALRHARAATEGSAQQMFLNTLGVALCRNGQYREAIPAFEQSLAIGNGQFEAYDLYFLAICHARLGDAAQARTCIERGNDWAESRKNLSDAERSELSTFRAEAEQALRTGAAARAHEPPR